MTEHSIDALVVEIRPSETRPGLYEGKLALTDRTIYFREYEIVPGLKRKADNEQVYEVRR